jgi:mannosyltransferase OCH1-like enzyme
MYKKIEVDDKPFSKEVPRIIHQTWKNTELNEAQQESVRSIKAAYPDYEHRLWTDDMLDEYAKTEFPDFYHDSWQRLTPFIRKVDTWRYMVLYKMGGMYADIDTVDHVNAEHLWRDLPGYAFVPTRNSRVNWTYNTDAASPAFLFSYPGNPFWLRVLEYIKAHLTVPYLKKYPKEETIFATGPGALSRVLLAIENKGIPPDPSMGIVFLSEPKFGLGGFKKILHKYCYHENRHNETWRSKTNASSS